jgi:small neutral amino acid transporter SnatA (MarC family)
MDATRVLIWIIGLALVVVAAFMLFFQTGLNRFVPLSIAGAGLLLIIGVAVMSMSEKMHDDHETVTEEHHEHH